MSLYKDASLVMLPSAYKDGKLYSIRPTDGSGDFTFSRGSNLAATRVDVNGLIEKGRENLLLQSNNFNTTWSKPNSTLTQGFSGYDGSNNAWKWSASVAGTIQLSQGTTGVSGMRTLSLYAKAGSRDVFSIWVGTGIDYNLTTGQAVGHANASMESVGNGWWRCSYFNDYGTLNPYFVASAAGEFIYIMNAQAEMGLVATDYIETGASTAQAGILEDMPRLDYSGGASCPALLLEPQRQNRLPHSEYFEGWTSSGATITSNYGESPEGKNNATRIVFSGSTGYVYYPAGTGVGSQTSTMYVKGTSGETILFGKGGNVASGSSFTLDGTWQRLEHTGTNLGSAFHISTFNSSTARDILVWGAQLEDASYPTSYIPTYGSSVTRSFDNMNSQAIVGDLSNNYTFFFDAVRLLDGDETQRWFYTTGLNGTNLQVYFISGGIDGRIRLFFRAAGGSSDSSITWELGPQEGSRYKIAIVRSEGSLKFFADGSLIGENTNNVPDELTYYNVFAGNGAQQLNQYAIFPTALTDSEAIALTL